MTGRRLGLRLRQSGRDGVMTGMDPGRVARSSAGVVTLVVS